MNEKLKITLGIVLTFFVLMLSSGFEIFMDSNFKTITQGISSQIAILLLSGLLIYFFTHKKYIEFIVKKTLIKQLFLPLLLTLILALFTTLINTDAHPVADSMSFIQIFFIVVLLASLSEELLFRGFLLNMISSLKIYRLKIYHLEISLSVIISALIFGIIHFGLLSVGMAFASVFKIVIFAFILGIIAGYFQEKHKNFIFPLLIHMTANLMGLLFSFL